MALTECKKCHKAISDKAIICPHCGYNMLEEKQKLTLGLSLSGIGIILLVIMLIIKILFF